MTTKVMLCITCAFGALASPIAVAHVTTHAINQSESWTDSLKQLGPAGALVVGLLGIVWRVATWLRPSIEAWFAAGTKERDAMRALAVSLRDRFEQEEQHDREELRKVLEELREKRDNR